MPKFLTFRWNKETQHKPVSAETLIESSEVVNDESFTKEKSDNSTKEHFEQDNDKTSDDNDSFEQKHDCSPDHEGKLNGLVHNIFDMSRLWSFHRNKEIVTHETEPNELSVNDTEFMNEIESCENTVEDEVVHDLEQNNNEPSDAAPDTSKCYVVFLPENQEDGTVFKYIFFSKDAAMAELKRNKNARFKTFDTEEEAEAFCSQPYSKVFPDMSNSDNEKPVAGLSPYSAPSRAEIIELRKLIERGTIEDFWIFEDLVNSNPRFLITNVDTPIVVMEGYHYNALHIAAKCYRPEFCQFIISSLEDEIWMSSLYPDNPKEAQIARIHHILDLYLNMPDKKLNETPLHFACKFGCYESVKALLSRSLCDRNRKNKKGQDAKSIICSRCLTMNLSAQKELTRRIESLFEEQYFVPVLRADENEIPPFIGEPYSPECLEKFKELPYDINSSPCSPKLSIMAVAGPMLKEQAGVFYKQWKTPNSKKSSLFVQNSCHIRLSDPEKGLERIGRTLAQDMKTQWNEFWPDLDIWCDFSTDEGMKILEGRLNNSERRVNFFSSYRRRIFYHRLNMKRNNRYEKNHDSGYIPPNSNSCPPETEFNKTPKYESNIATKGEFNPSFELSSSVFVNKPTDKKLLNHSDTEISLNVITPSCYSNSNVSNNERETVDLSKEHSIHERNYTNHLEVMPSATSVSELPANFVEPTDKKNIIETEPGDTIKSRLLNDLLSCTDSSNLIGDSLLCIETDTLDTVVEIMQYFLNLDSKLKISEDHSILSCKLLGKIMCLCNKTKAVERDMFNVLDITYKCVKDQFQNQEKSVVLKHLMSCINSEFHSAFIDDKGVLAKSERTSVFHEASSSHSKEQILNVLQILSNLIKRDLVSESGDIDLTKQQFHSNDLINCKDDLNTLCSEENVFDNTAIKLDFWDCDDDECDTNKLSDIKKNCFDDIENAVSSDLESSEDFVTPPSSPVQKCDSSDEFEVHTPPEGGEVYIEGKYPSKLDLDIYRVIENMPTDPLRYPCIVRWKHLMSTKEKKTIESWPSPAAASYRRHISYLNSKNDTETDLGQSPVSLDFKKFQIS